MCVAPHYVEIRGLVFSFYRVGSGGRIKVISLGLVLFLRQEKITSNVHPPASTSPLQGLFIDFEL